MKTLDERKRNHLAYRQLKEIINRTYPAGQFVAIFGGQIVADASTFKDVKLLLQARGLDPKDVLVVQPGVDYPETGVIFL